MPVRKPTGVAARVIACLRWLLFFIDGFAGIAAVAISFDDVDAASPILRRRQKVALVPSLRRQVSVVGRDVGKGE